MSANNSRTDLHRLESGNGETGQDRTDADILQFERFASNFVAKGCIMKRIIWLALGLIVLMTAAQADTPAQANDVMIQNVIDLGIMEGRGTGVAGLSVNGSVVVGSFYDTKKHEHAYRWTLAEGVRDIGAPDWKDGSSVAVSADGSVIIGKFTDTNYRIHVFRWTQVGGIRDLGAIGGLKAFAKNISADGSIITGSFWDTTNRTWHAFRWTQAKGVQDIGAIGGEGAGGLDELGASTDGSAIVGHFLDKTNRKHVFRWTENGGIQDLASMGGKSAAIGGVSADGSVIAGDFIDTDNHNHVFYWNQADGAQDISSISGATTEVRGVSADGSVVVGRFRYTGSIQDHVFRWSQKNGFQDLGNMNWKSADVIGVSADGSEIVGTFIYPNNNQNHILRWTQKMGIQDLGVISGKSSQVNGISADGSFIFGFFIDSNNNIHSFISPIDALIRLTSEEAPFALRKAISAVPNTSTGNDTSAMVQQNAQSGITSDQHADQQVSQRIHYLGRNITNHQIATYVDSCFKKVELVGSAHYPEKDGMGKIAGQVGATIFINANGTLNRVQINKSSGSKDIDDEVSNIARLASPFDVFPVALSNADEIAITRNWKFDPRKIDVTSDVSAHGRTADSEE